MLKAVDKPDIADRQSLPFDRGGPKGQATVQHSDLAGLHEDSDQPVGREQFFQHENCLRCFSAGRVPSYNCRSVDRAAKLRSKEDQRCVSRGRRSPVAATLICPRHRGGSVDRFALDSGEIAIVGRACRLPGAPNVAELWELLRAGGCAVSTIPANRWPLARHGHPSVREPGRSYTWAAGILPDIWGFDASVFRISPREAQQMDPQQRLLLELAFEACEEAGLAPSKLAGTPTGVYVGASALDYSTIGLHDPAVGDAYYATGNTLSIVANRLSYIFDLHGPSIALDTACSSSLVALHEARHALCRGEVDAALVGGVNILASPFQFVSFSQATMLSPTGLCRAFAAEADGYVRAEGGVVLVLKTLKRAVEDGDRIHAVIRGSGVNSDGRTSGISLRSAGTSAGQGRTPCRSDPTRPMSAIRAGFRACRPAQGDAHAGARRSKRPGGFILNKAQRQQEGGRGLLQPLSLPEKTAPKNMRQRPRPFCT